MDVHPRLLWSFVVLAALVVNATSTASDGCYESFSRKTYIVRVRPPPNLSIDKMSPTDLESWYRSFLPQSLAASKRPHETFVHTYREAMIGFAVNLTKDEVKDVMKRDGVLKVYEDKLYTLTTTHTPDFLGLRPSGGAWNSVGMGEGTVIGLVDTGIDASHVSFNDNGMKPPPAKWRGSCRFGNFKCNKKLIGGRSSDNDDDSIAESAGHGTHTASTAAGRFIEGASVLGSGNGTAAGMAPSAHIAMYQACDEHICLGNKIVAGIDAAIADGVDILSISIAAEPVEFLEDVIATSTFSAMRKGILVSCAAGNDGPRPNTVDNAEPWVLTVGASTMDRQMKAIVELGNGRSFVGESAYQPSSLVKLPLVYKEDGSERVKGKVVACEFDDNIASQEQIGQEVKGAGGLGMIALGQADNGHTTITEATDILPASYVNSKDATVIKEYIKRTDKPTASIIFNGTSLGTTPAPVVASFSSRGPSKVSRILKPDIIGPGVNVIAAWPFPVGSKTADEHHKTFNILSGTSMSTPHLSGIAAVIKSAHPDWSPAAIKSALMTTAYVADNMKRPIQDENFRPAGHFSIGSGHVDPSKAIDPGLVYDTDVEQYVLYLCGLGYTDYQVEIITHQKDACGGRKIAAAELNYPSIAVTASSGKIVVNRSVTNVGDPGSSYTVDIDMPEEITVCISPAKLQFTNLKEKKSFSVSLSWDAKKTKNAEGSFKWVSGKHVVRSPIVIYS